MTTSVIGALRINLGLNSARFSKGMASAQNSIKAFRAHFVGVAAAVTALGSAISAMALRGANDINRLATASRSLNTTVASVQALQIAANDVGIDGLDGSLVRLNRRLGAAEFGAGAAAVTVRALNLDLKALSKMDTDERVATIADALRDSGMSMQQVARHAQNLGFEQAAAAEFFLQGGDAIRAARDRLVEYGLAVSQVDASRIQEASTRISELGMIGQFVSQRLAAELVPAFGDVAKAMTDSLREGGLLRGVLDRLFDSLGTIARAAASLTAALGVRYAAALVVAKVGTFSLVGALTALRGAIIRTGIGAMIVAAGEVVYQFTRLVKAAGGFGNAMKLVGEVAREAWKRVGLHFDMLKARIDGGWKDMQADAHDMFAAIISGGVTFANRYIGIFNGAFEAIREIWSALPSAIGDFAFKAANTLISGVERMLNAVVSRINRFIEGVNWALSALPEWAVGEGGIKIGLVDDIDIGRIENPFEDAAKKAGRAAADAFKEGFQTDTFNQPAGLLGNLTGTADELRGQADAYREAAGMLSQAASGPMQAWERLKELLRGTKDEVEDVPPVAADAGDALTDLGDKGGAGGKKAAAGIKKTKKAVDELAKAAERGANAIGDLFADLMTGARSLKDGIIDLIREIARMQVMKGFKMLFGADGPLSSIGATLGGLLGSNANGTHNWRGGLTRIHERGGEILDLPAGTRIIPHDLSKRMLDQQGDMKLEVHIHENAADGQHQVRQSPGRIDVMLRKELNDMVRSGGLDGAIGQRFGMRAKAAGG